jgi:hypothetical protein
VPFAALIRFSVSPLEESVARNYFFRDEKVPDSLNLRVSGDVRALVINQ